MKYTAHDTCDKTYVSRQPRNVPDLGMSDVCVYTISFPSSFDVNLSSCREKLPMLDIFRLKDSQHNLWICLFPATQSREDKEMSDLPLNLIWDEELPNTVIKDMMDNGSQSLKKHFNSPFSPRPTDIKISQATATSYILLLTLMQAWYWIYFGWQLIYPEVCDPHLTPAMFTWSTCRSARSIWKHLTYSEY